MSSCFTACNKGHLGGSGPGVVRKMGVRCNQYSTLLHPFLPQCHAHFQYRKSIVDHQRSSAMPSLPLSDTPHPLLLSWEGPIQFRFLPLYVSLPPSPRPAPPAPYAARPELHYTLAEVTSCFYPCLSDARARALLRSSASDVSSLLGVRNFPHSCPSAQETDGGCDDELPLGEGYCKWDKLPISQVEARVLM